MRKNSILLAVLLQCSFISAQVYVNVREESARETSASFQVEEPNSTKGLGMPTVKLNNIADYSMFFASPKEGLLVYNTMVNEFVTQGYYYWSLQPSPHWEKMNGTVDYSSILQNIDVDILGYKPNIISINGPASISFGSTTASLNKCVKWELKDGGNDNIYCSYSTASELDFNKAFNLSKNAGGFVVTLTSDDEWEFVKTNLVNGVNSGFWIGYTAVKTPGNIFKYRWITNENWRNTWQNTSNTQNNFDQNKIINVPSSTSASLVFSNCSYIQNQFASVERKWAQRNCATSSGIKNLIIEFVTNNESF